MGRVRLVVEVHPDGEREHGNLRAALNWAVQNLEVETGARLAIALWWFWLERGYLSDGRRWVDALLARDGVEGQTGEAPHKLPAQKLICSGYQASWPWRKETTIAR